MQNRSRFAPLAFALLSACTSHSADPEPSEPIASGDAHALTLEPEPGSPLVASTAPNAWRWIHFGDRDGPFDDVGPKQIFAAGLDCQFQHDDAAHTAGKVCCSGDANGQALRWCQPLTEDFVPGVALASDGERLFVADYPAISSGAQIHAFSLPKGEPLWTRQALAIGPQAHSEYFNVVQLRLVEGQLIAYGAESHGAYIEAMDPTSGALLNHLTLDEPSLPAWRWTETEPEPKFDLALADGRHCTFEHDDEQDRSTLACAQPDGSPAWTRPVELDFVGRGTLIRAGDRLVLVSWGRISSGARAAAFALESGAQLWSTTLEGIGPQDHSKYSNVIQIELEGEDVLVVRGVESHGRYTEGRSISDGALRWSVIERGS